MSKGKIYCENVTINREFGDIRSSIVITSPNTLSALEKKQSAMEVINYLIQEYDITENELTDGEAHYAPEEAE